MRLNSPEFVVIPGTVEPQLDALYLVWQARVGAAEQIFSVLQTLQNKLRFQGVGSSLKLSTELLDFIESFARAHGLQKEDTLQPAQATSAVAHQENVVDYKRTKTHLIVKSERMVAALQALHTVTQEWMGTQQEQSASLHSSGQLSEALLEASEQLPQTTGASSGLEATLPIVSEKTEVTVNNRFNSSQIIELHTDWHNQQRLLATGTVLLLAQSSYVVRWLRSLDIQNILPELHISDPDQHGYVRIFVQGTAQLRQQALAQLTNLLPAIPVRQSIERSSYQSVRTAPEQPEQSAYLVPPELPAEEEQPLVLEFYPQEIQTAVQAVMAAAEYCYHVPVGSELEAALQTFMQTQILGNHYSESGWFIFKPTVRSEHYTIIHQLTKQPLRNDDFNDLAGILEYITGDALNQDYETEFSELE